MHNDIFLKKINQSINQSVKVDQEMPADISTDTSSALISVKFTWSTLPSFKSSNLQRLLDYSFSFVLQENKRKRPLNLFILVPNEKSFLLQLMSRHF